MPGLFCSLLLAASVPGLLPGAAESGTWGAQSGTITVSAAISLSEVLQEIGAAYEQSTGARVRFNFAASNVLARQIVNGAPVDVFISADEAQMEVVARAGALAPGSRRTVVENQLAVVALPEDLEAVRRDFPQAGPAIRRLAIGDTAAVPAGVYARRYLERQGLWVRYQSRLIPAGSVRAALAAVESGGADAAIVYVTDVRASRRARVAVALPREDTGPVTYPAAVLARTRKPREANRFLAFLQSDAGRELFVKHGFLVPQD